MKKTRMHSEDILYRDPMAHGLLANSRSIEEAVYSEPELPKFAGNPSIEALPLINMRARALDGMQRYPEYNKEMCQAGAHLRPHMAMDILHFFQPLSIHVKLEGMVSRMIRDGYLSRNPMSPQYSQDLKTRLKYFKETPHHGDYFSTTSSGFLICGMSGVGKTTGLVRVLNLYRQIILHNNYRGKRFTKTQVVWMIVECPKDGSTKGLCTEFFKTLDYVLGNGTNYAETIGKESRSTNDLMESMASLASTLQLGVLVIDEIQYLNVAKSGGAEQMLNFFVKLVNTIGVPVIITGTYDAIPLLTTTFRQARRSSGQGDLIWDPMECDKEWHEYIDSLFEYQYVMKKCLISESLSRTLNDVSYGVIDIANRVYLAAQIRAIENGTEEITEGLIRSAYRDDFRLVSHIIETLKSGDASLRNRIKDIHRPYILPIQDPDKNLISESGSIKEESQAIDSVANTLMPTSPDYKSDQQEVNVALTSKVKKEKADHHKKSQTLAQDRRRRKPNKDSAVNLTHEDRDLRAVIARGKASANPPHPYQALLSAGYIKNGAEFLQN